MHIFPDFKIILIQLVPFVVLLVGLNALVFQPMLDYLEERRKRIDGFKGQSDELSRDSDRKAKDIEAKMGEARAELVEARHKILSVAQAKERELLEGARRELEEKAALFHQQLMENQKRESEQLRTHVDTLAGGIASRVLGRAM